MDNIKTNIEKIENVNEFYKVILILSLIIILLNSCDTISTNSSKESAPSKLDTAGITKSQAPIEMKMINADRYGKLESVIFAPANENSVDINTQILGINLNNEPKAYPLNLLAYHHDIKDSVGNNPVWVTYCFMCRSGRIYDPQVNGEILNFKLVGLINNNVAYRDSKTNSLWLQETGKCINGEFVNLELNELFSEQVALKDWLIKYPNTKVLQYDPKFINWYQVADNSFNKSNDISLKPREERSLIIGVDINGYSKAYDWEILKKDQIIIDIVENVNLMLLCSADASSFYVYNRKVGNQILDFYIENETLIDTNTSSHWNLYGKCLSGDLAGTQLKQIQSYQEIWEAWNTFHPRTTRY